MLPTLKGAHRTDCRRGGWLAESRSRLVQCNARGLSLHLRGSRLARSLTVPSSRWEVGEFAPARVRPLPEYGDADSEREILDDFWPDLFAAMLNCWLTDEQQWPKNRTHQMFGEWFDLQMCPVGEDLHLDEELVELD